MNIFDALITICGLYLAINGIMMKVNGTINPGVVLSKNVKVDNIKDKEGFIKYMWPKLLICGLLCAAAGIFNMTFASMVGEGDIYLFIDLGVNALFFVLLIIYGLFAVKAQKLFVKQY